MIDEHMFFGIPYSKLYLVPELKNEKVEEFPFSYEFVASSVINEYEQ